MLVRPMLLHRMALVPVRLFCKNLGNLQEFFGQMVYCPPWQKLPVRLWHLDSKRLFSPPRCKRWKNEVCICKVEFKLLSVSSV